MERYMKRIVVGMMAILCISTTLYSAERETQDEAYDRFFTLVTTTPSDHPNLQARLQAINCILQDYSAFANVVFDVTDIESGVTLDYTPLIYALSSGNSALAMVLNAYSNPAQPLTGYTNLLDFAVQFPHYTDELLDNVYDLLEEHKLLIPGMSETVNEQGNTPLNQALLSQANPSIAANLIRILLDLGATPNPQQGIPPIFTAIAKNNLEAVAALIEYGADLDITDAHGNTPAQILAMQQHNAALDSLELNDNDDDENSNDEEDN